MERKVSKWASPTVDGAASMSVSAEALWLTVSLSSYPCDGVAMGLVVDVSMADGFVGVLLLLWGVSEEATPWGRSAP